MAISTSKSCPQCGDNHKGKPFCIYPDGYHCFSCGYHCSIDKQFTYKEKIDSVDYPEFPSTSHELSIDNTLWLNKYYVTPNHIKTHNIRQDKDGWLVFPSIVDGRLQFYQKRRIKPSRAIITEGRKTPTLFSTKESRTVVLVEDFISAIRVSEICDSICLWGVKAPFLTPEEWWNYSEILVWLDNDDTKQTNSGQEAAKKICKKLNYELRLKMKLYGFGNKSFPTIRNVVTEQDPKCYSNHEILEILRGNYATSSAQ